MSDNPLRQQIATALADATGSRWPAQAFLTEADAVLAVIQPELDALAALRQVARGYCPDCGRGDAAPTVTDWEQQKRRADQVEELLGIANDTANKSEAARAHAVQRAGRLAAILREVLDTFDGLRNSDGDGEVATYRSPQIFPAQYERWQAAARGEKAGQ